MRLHTRARRGIAVSLVAMAGVTAWASPAWAVPANDDRAAAEALPYDLLTAGDTTDATMESGEVAASCPVGWGGDGGNTVWYSVNVATTTNLVVTLDSATDQGVALWDSSGTSELACADSALGGATEQMTKVVDPGDYLISVYRFADGEQGPFTITATTQAPPPPPPPGGPAGSDPEFLDFGQVAVGDTSPIQMFNLWNAGNEPVGVAASSFDGEIEEYVFTGTTCEQVENYFVVPPGGCTFELAFQPQNVGPSPASITWQYTDAENQPQLFSTNFNGEGVDGGPPPEVPEAPLTVLLPGSTLLLGAGVYLVRRRGRTNPASVSTEA